MKKILFVIPTMRMGGAEQSLVSLLNQLDTNKYDIDVLLFEKKGELLERISNKINILETDTITRSMMLEFRYYFRDLLKERHFFAAVIRIVMLINSKIEDVTKHKNFFNWNIAKYFVEDRQKRYDVAIGYLEGVTDAYVIDKVHAEKKIGWIHTDFSKAQRHFRAEGRYYEQFNNIAIISSECKKHFLEHYPSMSEKTVIIENITDRQNIIKKATEKLDKSVLWGKHVFVTVGRLEYVKGIDLAIEAAAVLRDRNIDFIWHVFGDGAMRNELEMKIKKLGLENIFFLDGTTLNPYKYISKADLIIQPSRNEGKSMVLDESKLLCKPIVVTNYPSAKDQIENEKTGIIVDMNPENIADGIERVLKDHILRDKLIKNCSDEKDNTELMLEKIDEMFGNKEF